jgi:hypothetical protein
VPLKNRSSAQGALRALELSGLSGLKGASRCVWEPYGRHPITKYPTWIGAFAFERRPRTAKLHSDSISMDVSLHSIKPSATFFCCSHCARHRASQIHANHIPYRCSHPVVALSPRVQGMGTCKRYGFYVSAEFLRRAVDRRPGCWPGSLHDRGVVARYTVSFYIARSVIAAPRKRGSGG